MDEESEELKIDHEKRQKSKQNSGYYLCPNCGRKMTNDKTLTTITARVDEATREYVIKKGGSKYIRELIEKDTKGI